MDALLIKKGTINFWVIALAGLAAFGWMVADLVRVLLEVANGSGSSPAVFDGVVQHKVGELMVGVPFVAILALINLWPKNRIYSLIRFARPLMITGGLLNALAWFSLSDRVGPGDFLRLWCMVILAFGLTGSWLLARMVDRLEK